MMDVSLTEAIDAEKLLERLQAAADPGLLFLDARAVQKKEKNVGAKLAATDYLINLPDADATQLEERLQHLLESKQYPVTIVRKRIEKEIDARPAILTLSLVSSSLWPSEIGVVPEGPILHARLRQNMPAPRPEELSKALLQTDEAFRNVIVRIAYWREQRDGSLLSPMSLPPQPPEAPPLESGFAD